MRIEDAFVVRCFHFVVNSHACGFRQDARSVLYDGVYGRRKRHVLGTCIALRFI